MPTTHLVLRCEDVEACASFYENVLGVPVHRQEGPTADVELGPIVATLVPGEDPAGSAHGMIIEIEVIDVRDAVNVVRERGATVLTEPVRTEWGTESAFVEGPEAAMVVEFYRRR
ncbi:MAG: hypothetical protein QG622_2619 [Actinomycetota bacterium]|nr:hypothetical protein [Actinomycetota bacterium]